MESRETFLAPGVITSDVQVQPVLNILNSHRLLAMADIRSGLDPWVYATVAEMTTEQRRITRLLFQAACGVGAVETSREWDDFEEFLAAYEAADPVAIMRDDLTAWCASRPEAGTEQDALSPDDLIADVERYIAAVQTGGKEDYILDPEFLREAYRFVSEPEVMHGVTVDHLRGMWEQFLRPEWERQRPFVEESVQAFAPLKWGRSTLVDDVRLFTGRDISQWMGQPYYARLTAATFVPSPHMGPYISTYDTADPLHARFVFGARIPDAAVAPGAESASSFEVLTRLEALADRTRLQIIRLLAERGVLSTEEIMGATGLTKSTASRHLKQLSATGLLLERREGGAKKVYTLNRATADRLLRALDSLLSGG